MTIDVAALKQFQAAFEPLVKAVPAIIDGLNAQADLDRSLAAKRKQLEELAVKRTKLESEAADSLANVQLMVKQEQDRLAAVKQALREEREAAAAAALSAQTAAEATMQSLASQRTVLTESVSRLSDQYEAKRAAMESELSVARKAAAAEIDALNARKHEAETALAAIRAKLG